MNTYVISVEDHRDITALLETYRPYLHSEVEQMLLLRQKLDEAVIVPTEKLARSIVSMGALVRIADLRLRTDDDLRLVYPKDASPALRCISLLSPLGTAILGCDEGAVVEIALPVSTLQFVVRSVLSQPQSLERLAGADIELRRVR